MGGNIGIGFGSGGGSGGGIEEAPQDGKQYARVDAGWAEVVGDGSGITDAPQDGKQYARVDGAWVEVVGSGLEEAPQDGKQYARVDAGWVEVVGDGSGITDAPQDGKQYARIDGAWVEVAPVAGGATGAATLGIAAGESATSHQAVTFAGGQIGEIGETPVPAGAGLETDTGLLYTTGTVQNAAYSQHCYVEHLDVVYLNMLTAGNTVASISIGTPQGDDTYLWSAPIDLVNVTNRAVLAYDPDNETVVAMYTDVNDKPNIVVIDPGATSLTEGAPQLLSDEVIDGGFQTEWLHNPSRLAVLFKDDNDLLRILSASFSDTGVMTVETDTQMDAAAGVASTLFLVPGGLSSVYAFWGEAGSIGRNQRLQFKSGSPVKNSVQTYLNGPSGSITKATRRVAGSAKGNRIAIARDNYISPTTGRTIDVSFGNPSDDNLGQINMSTVAQITDPQEVYLDTDWGLVVTDQGVGILSWLDGPQTSGDPGYARYSTIERDFNSGIAPTLSTFNIQPSNDHANWTDTILDRNKSGAVFVYRSWDGTEYQSRRIVPAHTVSNYEDFGGVALDSGGPGDDIPVLLPGGIAGGFSGLTPGQKVYVQTDGSIGNTVNGPAVGYALDDVTIRLYDEDYVENPTSLGEAPQDGKQYVRVNGAWVEAVGDGTGLPEAPEDGKQYVRVNGAWVEVVGDGTGLPEAPEDGKQYARIDAGWAEVAASGGSDGLTLTSATDLTALRGFGLDASGDAITTVGSMVPGSLGPVSDLTSDESLLECVYVAHMNQYYQCEYPGGAFVNITIGTPSDPDGGGTITWGAVIQLSVVTNLPNLAYDAHSQKVIAYYKQFNESKLYAVALTPTSPTTFTESARFEVQGSNIDDTERSACYIPQLQATGILFETTHAANHTLVVKVISYDSGSPVNIMTSVMADTADDLVDVNLVADTPTTLTAMWRELTSNTIVRYQRASFSGVTPTWSAVSTITMASAPSFLEVDGNPNARRVAMVGRISSEPFIWLLVPPSGATDNGAFDHDNIKVSTVDSASYLDVAVSDSGEAVVLHYMSTDTPSLRYTTASRDDTLVPIVLTYRGQVSVGNELGTEPTLTAAIGGSNILATYPDEPSQDIKSRVIGTRTLSAGSAFDGIALETVTSGNPVKVAMPGDYVEGFTGLTAGDPVYLQTDGTISHTVEGDHIGEAVSATIIQLYGRDGPVDTEAYVQLGRTQVPLIQYLLDNGFTNGPS